MCKHMLTLLQCKVSESVLLILIPASDEVKGDSFVSEGIRCAAQVASRITWKDVEEACFDSTEVWKMLPTRLLQSQTPLYYFIFQNIYVSCKAERKRCLLFLHVPEVAFLCSQAAATWLREQPLKLVMPPLFQRDRSRRPVIAVGLQNLGWLWRKFQGAIGDQERTCLRMKEDGFSKGIRHRRLHKEDLTHLGFSQKVIWHVILKTQIMLSFFLLVPFSQVVGSLY